MKSLLNHIINSRYTNLPRFHTLHQDGIHLRHQQNWQLLLSQIFKQKHHRREFAIDSSASSDPILSEGEEGKPHGAYEMKDPESEDQVVNINIVSKDGTEHKVRGKIGDNLLYLAKRYEVEMEGACEASLACTTCHVYVNDDFYDKFDPPSEKEEDLLDMAPFLKENSRLGCQLILQEKHRGLKVSLPSATKNFYVDGHKPSHH